MSETEITDEIEQPEPTAEQIQIQKIQAGLRLLGYETGSEFSGELDAETTEKINKFITDNELSIQPDDTDAILEAMSTRVRDADVLERMAEIAAKGDEASSLEIFTLQIGLILNDIQSAFDGNFASLGTDGATGFLDKLANYFKEWPAEEETIDPNPIRNSDVPTPGFFEMAPTENIAELQETARLDAERARIKAEQDRIEYEREKAEFEAERERPAAIPDDPTPEMMADAYIYHLMERGITITEDQATLLRSLVQDYESTEITRETAADAIRAGREASGREIDLIDDDINYMNQQVALYRAQGMNEHEATIRGFQDMQKEIDIRHGVENTIASPATILESFIKGHAFNERNGPLTDEQRAEIQELSVSGRMPSERFTILDYHSQVITGRAYGGMPRVDTERLARDELQPRDPNAPDYQPIPLYSRDVDEQLRALDHQEQRTGRESDQRAALLERKLQEAEEDGISPPPRQTNGDAAEEETEELDTGFLNEAAQDRTLEAAEELENLETTSLLRPDGDIESEIQLASTEWVAAQQAEGIALDVLAREPVVTAALDETKDLETAGQTASTQTFTV